MRKIKLTYLIDDDEIYIFTAKKLINKTDFSEEVKFFYNGKEALEAIKSKLYNEEELPEVILLDLNMPIMDGWQFLDEFIRIKTKKTIKVYIVSSSVNPVDLERAKTYNMVSNYIVKPISREKLYSITEEVFS
ncbi:response regulator [Mesoflavibacter sp. SCSIO 43206]|jgi:CheY-like chemotaxis protein|uniref:response regulator n=1 Tax=Mesoflavibacter TaxID=444051 RepID=UPI001CA92E53|nr:response regulator [Mesoflavibacter sp. SCSIO 43206]UAB74589.1 response regulator [Mesoflavibacter sp. SCSIO 43206]